ncbi:MAG: DUF2312 domain-containing protein [Lentilitoribacter sp.]
MAGKGHNSKSPEITIGNVAGGQLRSFVERIERLNEEKQTIADDIKEVFGELKAMGYDAKTVRRIIQIRKQDQNERMEQEAVLDTYLAALGMLPQDDFGGDADE